MRAAQFILFWLYLVSSAAIASWDVNLPLGVTPVSHDIYDLHMTIFWICVAIGVVVFGVMFYAIIHHRKSLGAKAAHFHEHLWLELTWTFIPFVILIVMAIPATKVLIHIRDTTESDITIKITGHQWKWEYEYLNEGIHFFSNITTPFAQIHNLAPKDEDYLRTVDHPLVVPIHKKIRFLVTSDDVIHSWWVPAFGVKQDAIPGFIIEAWSRVNQPGVYHGQCAELCGMNHAFMPIVVVAMGETDFANWVIQQKGGTAPAATIAPATPANNPAQATSTAAPSTAMPVKTTTVTNIPTSAGTKPTTVSPAIPIVSPATTHATTSTMPAAVASPTSTATAPTTTTATTAKPTTAAAPLTLDEQMKKGETIFLNTCAACHQPTGEGLPPTYPALKSSPIATGPLPKHLSRVLFGKPGTAMQAFKDQFTDEELSAVITYERNAFGNNTKDVVQPSDVTAAKEKGPLPE